MKRKKCEVCKIIRDEFKMAILTPDSEGSGGRVNMCYLKTINFCPECGISTDSDEFKKIKKHFLGESVLYDPKK